MDEKRFPLQRMRATAQQITDDADVLGQELNSRMQQIDQTELQLSSSQRATLESYLATLRDDLSALIAAEMNLAQELRDAADEGEATDFGNAHGFITS